MKQIKVPLTPREWAEKRFSLYLTTSASRLNNTMLASFDEDIELCGFYLVEDEPETKPDEIPTDKVEAVKYFLNQLPDGYKERALWQINTERINLLKRATTMPEAINAMTHWATTKENFHFWDDVDAHYRSLLAIKPLPPLPKE